MLPAENVLPDHARALIGCVREHPSALAAAAEAYAYGCPNCRACVRVSGLVTVAVKVRCSSCGWSAAAWRGESEKPPGNQ